MAASNIRNLV